MSQKINFSDYSGSGVYFMEIDNSVVSTPSVVSALRIAVGFNMQGPFNRPVYVSDPETCTKLFGGIDRRLERRGCFTNRNVRTLITKAPTYVLNLLPVDTSNKTSNKDTVGYALFSLKQGIDSSIFKGPYAHMYDRTKFWIADENAFVNNRFIADSSIMAKTAITTYEESALFGIANCGTKDISVIVRKSENVSGYNVTFRDYYGSTDDIPYAWINPEDYVSDYFVDVIVVSGNWGPSKYAALSGDALWSNYFTSEGIKKDKLSKFLRSDAVTVLGQYTGCIIPNFLDKQGNCKSIDYLVNRYSNETGLMFGINEKALDSIALDSSVGYFVDSDGSGVYESDKDKLTNFIPDMVGHKLDASANKFTYFSSILDCSTGNIFKVKSVADSSIDSSTMFTLDASSGVKVNVGDYVKGVNGLLSKIIKKRGFKKDSVDTYRYTASGVVLDSSTIKDIEIHKPIASMYDTMKFYDLSGLKICNRHMPGFDADGKADDEKGIEKIYSMLEDSGINKGLLNDDLIDFRYIVDTMSHGLMNYCGGKKYLSRLANKKQHCTALVNAPSMKEFAESDAPFFGDDWTDKEDARPTFNVKYIPLGGNQDMVYSANTESFTLVDEEWGATNTAVFGCYPLYADGNKNILVPPAADVCNAMMNKFMGGNPYAAIANTDGILENSNIVGVEYNCDKEERGYLESMGINPIIDRGGRVMIYGDKTAYQTVNSALSALHSRELINTIQIVCTGILQDYVYKYNVPTTRAEIVRRINPVLEPMKASGALTKYEVICDDSNNDKTVIDNKFCICEIVVYVSDVMEKIVVPITVNRGTSA